NVFNVFSTFASGLPAALATTPALQFEARGTYDRASNTFNAISVNVVSRGASAEPPGRLRSPVQPRNS
ncbi:MAG: hypothetical protein ABSG18_15245, partial [Steroidobacteraceae bacterium]